MPTPRSSTCTHSCASFFPFTRTQQVDLLLSLAAQKAELVRAAALLRQRHFASTLQGSNELVHSVNEMLDEFDVVSEGVLALSVADARSANGTYGLWTEF